MASVSFFMYFPLMRPFEKRGVLGGTSQPPRSLKFYMVSIQLQENGKTHRAKFKSNFCFFLPPVTSGRQNVIYHGSFGENYFFSNSSFCQPVVRLPGNITQCFYHFHQFQREMGKKLKMRFYKVLAFHMNHRNRRRFEPDDSQSSTPILTALKTIGEPEYSPKYLLAKR